MIDPNIIANLHNYIAINPQVRAPCLALPPASAIRGCLPSALPVCPALFCGSLFVQGRRRARPTSVPQQFCLSPIHRLLQPAAGHRGRAAAAQAAGAHGSGPCHCGDHLPSGGPLRHHCLHDHAGGSNQPGPRSGGGVRSRGAVARACVPGVRLGAWPACVHASPIRPRLCAPVLSTCRCRQTLTRRCSRCTANPVHLCRSWC